MKFYVITALFAILFKESLALNCYQCTGSDPTKPFQCNEWLNSDIDIEPEPCDNVYDAKYCIKHIGRFEASGIMCYQCSIKETLECSDGMIHLSVGGEDGIKPKSCDYVFEAQYCVKTISLDGGIGAKRFCSSLDLGNYCNYVKQPGDILSYRTCVFTCSGDGCNSSHTTKPTSFVLYLILGILTYCLSYKAFVKITWN